MRNALRLSAAVLFSLVAYSAAAQEPDPAPAPPQAAPATAEEDVLTWDELPEAIRRRAAPMLGRPTPQAVLNVENAIQPDADFRDIDHGDVMFEQWVRPAAVARITRSVRNGEKYGPVGAALWPGIGPDGDYWCWRRFNPENAFARGNIYCYLDKNGDGVSEQLMENNFWQGGIPASRFQFLTFGHDEGVEESAAFEVEPDALGEFRELVVLRYYGATRGVLKADGSLGPALVEFEVLTGLDHGSLNEASRIRIRTDANGRGQYHGLNGIRLMVDGVNVDGSVRARLVGALPTGRGLLFPATTRELVVERMSEFFNPDGTPKAPAASGE